MRHIIFIVCTILLTSVICLSCASRKQYQEHKEIQAATVSGSSMAANTVQIDSVLTRLSMTADSIEIVIEPYLIPNSDSIADRTTIRIRSPTVSNITEATSTISTNVMRNDSTITDSRETSDIHSDAQLSQDAGATSVLIFIVIGIAAIVIIVAIILVRRYLR